MTIDLAREPDFTVGPIKIRPSLRQVENGAASETLEPRVMQVLVALSQRRGEVVSRDELLERCWDGRVVGEDAISRCIARVRKLGETHGAFSLETIARVGYRLTPAGEAAMATVRPERMAAAAPPAARPFDLQTMLKKREVWVVGGVLLVALVAAVFLLRSPATAAPDVDAVVARLTEKLSETASKRDIDQVGAAAKELGASTRPEERSAFAALASGNALQAIEGLEALAQEFEASGDTKSAATVYTRIGALALVIDQGRGLAARRRAILLAPDSLNAFQGLLLDMLLLRGPPEALQLAKDTLERPGLSDRMRGWVLAHRGLVEIDILGQGVAAQRTLEEIQEIHRRTGDDIVEYSIVWLSSLLARNRDDLSETRMLAQRASDLRPRLSERVPNLIDATTVRVMLASGDWSGAFSFGAANLDERGRTGDFLPAPVIEAVCVSGIFSGQAVGAESYCRPLTKRLDNTGGVKPRAYAGLLAAGLGDDRTASTELAAAEAMLTPGSPVQMDVWVFKAFAALKRNDADEAERLVNAAVEQSSKSGLRTYRSFSANALRLLGEGFIANGQPARACAPLGKAGRLYAEIGGDAGRAAVDVLRGAVACR